MPNRRKPSLKVAELDALIIESVRHLPNSEGFKSLTDIAAFGGLRTAHFGRIMDRCAKLASKGVLVYRNGGADFGDMYAAR